MQNEKVFFRWKSLTAKLLPVAETMGSLQHNDVQSSKLRKFSSNSGSTKQKPSIRTFPASAFEDSPLAHTLLRHKESHYFCITLQ